MIGGLKTLSRYLLLDFIGPLLLALLVLTFILLMDRLFLLIDLLVRKGVSTGVVGELVLLSIPFTMTVSTPLSMLIAAVMSCGRASHDNEIAALRSAGIQVFRVFIPVVILGVALGGLMLYFNGYVAAEANYRLRNLMMDLAIKKPAIRIEPGVFLQDFEGYTIYIGALDERTSRIRDIRIYDRTQGGTPDLIVAPRGTIGTTPDEKYLTLTLDSGAVHQYLGDSKYRRLEFKEHIINLPFNEDLVRKDREYRGNREMTLPALAKRMRAAAGDVKTEARNVREITKKGKLMAGDSMRLDETRTRLRFKQRELDRLSTEANKRYSLAFSCFLFLFFGAPLGILLRRGGLGIGFLVGLLFFAAFYVLILAGEELANAGRLSPFLSMWLGNIILLPVIVELCARAFFERSFVRQAWRWLHDPSGGHDPNRRDSGSCPPTHP
jgi:lipopolysaccharide export system permease protein